MAWASAALCLEAWANCQPDGPACSGVLHLADHARKGANSDERSCKTAPNAAWVTHRVRGPVCELRHRHRLGGDSERFQNAWRTACDLAASLASRPAARRPEHGLHTLDEVVSRSARELDVSRAHRLAAC